MSLHSSVEKVFQTIQDPDLKQSLWTLGMVRDLEVNATEVRARIVLATPACPWKEQIQNEIETALLKLPGVERVNLKMDAEVKPAKRALSHQGGQRTPGVNSIEGVHHLIAVSSGKGGVGKSTVAVNLACALAKEGARVGLMDTDVYGPNVPLMMGITEAPKLIRDDRGERFVPPMRHGVKVMSMGFLVDPEQPVVWRGPMLHSVIQQFCHQVEWGALDYLVVDMPPGTGDVQLSLAQMVGITGAILVTTPQEVSLQDVRKAYGMFEKVRVPILGFVENMSFFQPVGKEERYYIFGQGGGKKLADKYHQELLAQLPIVEAIREGGDQGLPLVVQQPDHPTSKAYRSLCQRVAQKIALMAAEGIDPNELVQIGKF